MAQNFQADREGPEQILEGQLRECYGRAVYSHKTHEKCADILLSRLAAVKFWQILLSAATTAGFIFTIFDSVHILAIVGAAVSTGLLVLNFYTRDSDLGALAQKHAQAASDIWLIREQYQSLIADLRMGRESIDNSRERRDALSGQLHAVYAGAPNTNNRAYKKAQEALKVNEDMTFSDDEIDAFLPRELRRIAPT